METYVTRSAAERSIGDYIERFYNTERLHSHIDYVNPIEFELKMKISRNCGIARLSARSGDLHVGSEPHAIAVRVSSNGYHRLHRVPVRRRSASGYPRSSARRSAVSAGVVTRELRYSRARGYGRGREPARRRLTRAPIAGRGRGVEDPPFGEAITVEECVSPCEV